MRCKNFRIFGEVDQNPVPCYNCGMNRQQQIMDKAYQLAVAKAKAEYGIDADEDHNQIDIVNSLQDEYFIELGGDWEEWDKHSQSV